VHYVCYQQSICYCTPFGGAVHASACAALLLCWLLQITLNSG
jgi:hypothetical protein